VSLQAVSGDADLPVREDLGERRRNYEIQQAAKASVTNDTDDSDGKAEGNGQDEDKDPEEDDFYMQAKQLKEAKQAAKAAKYSRFAMAILLGTLYMDTFFHFDLTSTTSQACHPSFVLS
jgi:hypothetical protein